MKTLLQTKLSNKALSASTATLHISTARRLVSETCTVLIFSLTFPLTENCAVQYFLDSSKLEHVLSNAGQPLPNGKWLSDYVSINRYFFAHYIHSVLQTHQRHFPPQMKSTCVSSHPASACVCTNTSQSERRKANRKNRCQSNNLRFSRKTSSRSRRKVDSEMLSNLEWNIRKSACFQLIKTNRKVRSR